MSEGKTTRTYDESYRKVTDILYMAPNQIIPPVSIVIEEPA